VVFRGGRDSIQQGGARQGGVAALKCGIVRWKVGFAPGAITVVIAVGSAARASAALSEDALLLCDNEAVLRVIRKWVGQGGKQR
jgi:hypothetical protein